MFYKKATLKRYHLYWGKLVRESVCGQKCINLYENQEQQSAAVSVELRDALSVKTVEGRGQRYEFQVLTTSGKHQFAAKTEEECRVWMEKLDRMLHGPPEAGVTYEFQLQILPTSHSDKLGLGGCYLMRVMDEAMMLYSASGGLPTQFQCELAHITKVRYTNITTSGGLNSPLLTLQTNKCAKIGEGGFAFSARSAANIAMVINYRRRPQPPPKPRKAQATDPGAPTISPRTLQPQQGRITQDKNSSGTANSSHLAPSSHKPATAPKPQITPRLPVGPTQHQRSTSPLPPSTTSPKSFLQTRLLPEKTLSSPALPTAIIPSASDTPPKVLCKPLNGSCSKLTSPSTPTKADRRRSWILSPQCSDESDFETPNSWIGVATEDDHIAEQEVSASASPALKCRPTEPHPPSKESGYIHILPSENGSMPATRSPKVVVRELPEARVMRRKSTIRRAISEELLRTNADIHKDFRESLNLQDNPFYGANGSIISHYASLRTEPEDGSPYSILYANVDSHPPVHSPGTEVNEAYDPAEYCPEDLSYDYIVHGAFYTRRESVQATTYIDINRNGQRSDIPSVIDEGASQRDHEKGKPCLERRPSPPPRLPDTF